MPSIENPLSKWLAALDRRTPASLPIYRAVPVDTSPRRVKAIAERLRLGGELHEVDKDHTVVRDDRRVLIHYNRSGAFRYVDLDLLAAGHDRRAELPSTTEARDRALEFLKERGWLSEGVEVDRIEPLATELVQGRTRKVIPQQICVDLRLRLGQHKTYGPGAKIKVNIGHGGEIVGVLHAVREYRAADEARRRPAQALGEILRRRLGRDLDAIDVENALFAYYAESPALEGRLAQPVHVLSLRCPTKVRDGERMISFMTHPLPATDAAPLIFIDRRGDGPITIKQGEPLRLRAAASGGAEPLRYRWSSDLAGDLGEGPALKTEALRPAKREGRPISHTVKVHVTDAHGNEDSHQVLVTVQGEGPAIHRLDPRRVEPRVVSPIGVTPRVITPPDDDPYVGDEWCNLYHGTPGLADISGTDDSAKSFNRVLRDLPNWSSRFDWGNDAAWEQDFKMVGAAGGGTDTWWADHVHFAFFAGHGSLGRFYFGSTRDDHEMRAEDARWGDGILNWVVLHACQTMQNNFRWDVWCDAFVGLHQMFGFHTNTEGSSPALGGRFAMWMSFSLPFVGGLFTMRQAWAMACSDCFDATVEYAMIYAGQSGTDTHNDHLPGFGHVSADPTSPNFFAYTKASC